MGATSLRGEKLGDLPNAEIITLLPYSQFVEAAGKTTNFFTDLFLENKTVFHSSLEFTMGGGAVWKDRVTESRIALFSWQEAATCPKHPHTL